MTIESARRAEDILDRAVCLPQHIVYRVFPAETVVLNLDSGKYHGLDPVGGRFLAVLEAAGSVRGALATLVEEFPGQDPLEIETDLTEFCAELGERGLIELGTGGGA